MTEHTVNREAWLQLAVSELRPLLRQLAGAECPEVRVSVGWPKGRARAVGQCWPTSAAGDKVAQIFVSPSVAEPVAVLGILLHEMIHAANDCKDQHKGPFARWHKAVGFERPATQSVLSDELADTLRSVLADLPEYPHKSLTPKTDSEAKKQTTRMIKLECPECGYIVRTTQKWVDAGLPSCGLCHDVAFQVTT